jgi:hypothetical protein
LQINLAVLGSVKIAEVADDQQLNLHVDCLHDHLNSGSCFLVNNNSSNDYYKLNFIDVRGLNLIMIIITNIKVNKQ